MKSNMTPVEAAIVDAKLEEIAKLPVAQRKKEVARLFPALPGETQTQRLRRFAREAAALRTLARCYHE